MIKNLNNLTPLIKLYNKDENDREIFIYKVSDAYTISESIFYPNVLFFCNESDILKPINEDIMSLKNVQQNIKVSESSKIENICSDNLFFFIYNTENYYHFVYDSLPYLISYFKLKHQIPDLKLLINYPNNQKKEHYKFVIEFLSILGINENDMVMIQKNTKYKNLYISNSYTHDGKSNLPPRKEIYDLYLKITNIVLTNNQNLELPKNIYVSRRTWKHNNFTNIGTNYTTRRNMVNETELVDYLNTLGYEEVFTENLSTSDKILMFNNAENVIGSIGGGICNVLFSKKNTNLLAIESPGFLSINSRFLNSLNRVRLNIFKNTSHVDSGDFKRYMRVKYLDIVGEIIDIEQDMVTISYTDEFVAGWNNEINYKKIKVLTKDCYKIDNGLNSPWSIDMESFKKCLNQN